MICSHPLSRVSPSTETISPIWKAGSEGCVLFSIDAPSTSSTLLLFSTTVLLNSSPIGTTFSIFLTFLFCSLSFFASLRHSAFFRTRVCLFFFCPTWFPRATEDFPTMKIFWQAKSNGTICDKHTFRMKQTKNWPRGRRQWRDLISFHMISLPNEPLSLIYSL